MISAGRGRHRVWLKKEKLGDELVFILGGGDAHLGAIAVSRPDCDTNYTVLPGHKDDAVVVMLAEAASKKYKTQVTVLGGIHVDNATKADIEKIKKNCGVLARKL